MDDLVDQTAQFEADEFRSRWRELSETWQTVMDTDDSHMIEIFYGTWPDAIDYALKRLVSTWENLLPEAAERRSVLKNVNLVKDLSGLRPQVDTEKLEKCLEDSQQSSTEFGQRLRRISYRIPTAQLLRETCAVVLDIIEDGDTLDYKELKALFVTIKPTTYFYKDCLDMFFPPSTPTPRLQKIGAFGQRLESEIVMRPYAAEVLDSQPMVADTSPEESEVIGGEGSSPPTSDRQKPTRQSTSSRYSTTESASSSATVTEGGPRWINALPGQSLQYKPVAEVGTWVGSKRIRFVKVTSLNRYFLGRA